MSKKSHKKHPVQVRDSFHTALENAGAWKRDITSRFNGGFLIEGRLPYEELNAVYQSVPIVRRALELITGHLLKNGVSFSIPNNAEATAAVQELAKEIKLNKLFEEAALITLINGCGGVLLVDKNQNPEKPVDLKKLHGRKPKFTVVDGRWLTCTPDLDPFSPNFYKPVAIQVVGKSLAPNWVNLFYGLPVSQVIAPQYKYFGMSLIENAYITIVNDQLLSKAVPNMVYRSSYPNYRIEGLKEALRTGEEQNILKYVSTAENAVSILNATITDTTDDVQILQRQLAGLSELDMRSAYRLSAALGLPATVLWGKSPDGMNATGNSDMENFYNSIGVWQERWYENLRWFYRVLIACVTGRDDVNFELSFNKVNLISPQQKVANDSVILQNCAAMRDLGLPDGAINRYLVDNEILTENEAVEYEETQAEMESLLPGGLELGGDDDESGSNGESKEVQEAKRKEERPGKLPAVQEKAENETPRRLKSGVKPIKAITDKVASLWGKIKSLVKDSPEFKEEEHPRGEGGKFTKKGEAEESSKANKAEELKNFLGKEYQGFKGQAAVEKLIKEKQGHIKSAFTREDIGDIALVWGNENIGLKHIIQQREKQNIDPINFLSDLSEVIENGLIKPGKRGRLEITSGLKTAVILPEYYGEKVQLVLTAFENKDKKEEPIRSE